ncbi:MAG: hypothetical protein DI586_03810 [Micavibrio aeruginosavorus]|uniref:Uncharacterized protein n=1 Tax=Micavibrio aeruginosavorus TaxID=349221 RepID=A0A2W5FN22_9BACT|nr:MAG: hypothetical protein DI586_03810 [Micavibrio aeruginosavorus]
MSKLNLFLCSFISTNPSPQTNGILLQKALFSIYNRTSDPLQSETNFKARLRDIYAEAKDGNVIYINEFTSALKQGRRAYGPKFMGH